MFDRPQLQRTAGYSYAQDSSPVPQKHYPTAHSTSSAFSASANSNEDWTKISDLAERRRIQNRIAQRNYRKKLKKRLEDLERRAGSSSASPEQSHEDLDESEPTHSSRASTSSTKSQRSASRQVRRDRTPEVLNQQYVLPTDDRGMFSQQYTRQLSTSPPPFSYAALQATESVSYSTYPPPTTYCSVPDMDMPLYPQYLPPIQQSYGSLGNAFVKQEYLGDDEMSPFSMSYASMAGMDDSSSHTYQDVAPYTPPLSDSFDSSVASPPESTNFPRTPLSMPRTPPVHTYDR